jgi:hypothetical protein
VMSIIDVMRSIMIGLKIEIVNRNETVLVDNLRSPGIRKTLQEFQ